MAARTLRVWSMSLETIGRARFECVYPLSEEEVEDVLAWLDIIRRQVSKFGVRAELTAPDEGRV
jgi:hypothetical protein